MASDHLIPCIIHVPCRYPDGEDIEPELMNTILEVFDRQFDGSSNLGVIEGRWRGIVEPMLRIEVSIRKSEIARFETIARAIGRATMQEAIYVVINYKSETRILPMDDEDDDDQSFSSLGGPVK